MLKSLIKSLDKEIYILYNYHCCDANSFTN